MTTPTPYSSRRLTIEFAAVGVISLLLLVVLPLLAPYGVTSGLWGKYLSYALLAISVDLLWGSTGLLSLGQALFFSLGGYMHGMYLMRMIGELGQYKKPIPDFLVFLGWTKLPPFWEPFSSFGFAMLMVVIVPAIIAYIFGYLAFRSRIKGVYFSILTQALTYAASIIFFRNNLLMGGNNGFTDFKFILGHSLVDKVQGPKTMTALYVVTGVTVLLAYLFRRWLRTTKFGLVQQAIRDGENRTLFSGYATSHYKLFVFVLCAIIASIGGALYVPQAGIINPEEMKTANSLEAVVWVAVGGRGTLFGPILGAVSVNALKSWATQGVTANYWPIIIGGLFILVVLFLPGGLVSLPNRLSAIFKRKKPVDEAPVAGTNSPVQTYSQEASEAFYNVAVSGDLAGLRKLHEKNPALVRSTDKYGFTALHGVAGESNLKVAEFLLDQGADVNAKNDDGIAPLHLAADPEMVELLVRRGAIIDIRSDDDSTPLIAQAEHPDGLDTMQALLKLGANANAANKAGDTALSVARSREEPDKVRLLEEYLSKASSERSSS